MKIEILSNTIANDKVAMIGDILDINPKDGRFLVALGKAVELIEVEPLEVVETEVITDDIKIRRRVRST